MPEVTTIQILQIPSVEAVRAWFVALFSSSLSQSLQRTRYALRWALPHQADIYVRHQWHTASTIPVMHTLSGH